MSYPFHTPPDVLPRIELKYQAKDLMRGNWPVLIGVTLLFLLLTAAQVTYTVDVPTEVVDPNNQMTVAQSVFEYFNLTVSSLAGAIASFGLGKTVLFGIVAIVSALLINGVLTYCYNAWYVTLMEIGHSRPLTFNDFVDTFSGGLRGMLGYIWRELWLIIWSLVGIPGFVILALQTSQVVAMTNNDAYFASIATGGSMFGIFAGSLLSLAAGVLLIIIDIRYSFVFQFLADGRGKVNARQALRYSCTITKGHVGQLFVLQLSFIPWYLLGIFSLGIGMFYLYPYLSTTMTLSYRWLRDKAFSEGRLDPAALGYVQAGEQQHADGVTVDV